MCTSIFIAEVQKLSKAPYACLLFLLVADGRCLTLRAGKEVWMGEVFYW